VGRTRAKTVRRRQSCRQKFGHPVSYVQRERNRGIAELDSRGAVPGILANSEPASREFVQLELAIFADPLSVYSTECTRSPFSKGSVI